MNPYRPGTNLFGQQQGQQPPTTNGGNGLFGQPNAASPFGQQQGTSSIFSQQQNTPALFGQQPATSSLPFGQSNATVAPFGQPAGGSLPFGQQTNRTPSLFGQSAGSGASADPFGATSGTTNTAQQAGGFGAPIQPSLFTASNPLSSSAAAPVQTFGSSNGTLFSSASSPSANVFGTSAFQPSSLSMGTAQASAPGQAPFGSCAVASNPLGQAAAPNVSSSGTQGTTPGQASVVSPFGSQNNTAGAFGQPGVTNGPPALGLSQSNAAAGQAPATGSTMFGQGNAPSLFSQSASSAASNPPPFGQPASSNTPVAPAINTQAAHSFQPASTFQPNAPKPSDGPGFATSVAAEAPVDQSCLMSSIKDNSVNLYNLKLKEIIDMQVEVLDKNIKEFRKEVRAIFDRDMQLIRAKNAFVEQQKNIEKEKAMMDELSGLLDHLEKELDNLPVGTETAMGSCVAEFENICDRFYKVVENLQDEQGEVMDILNENYELVSVIDKKLDALERYSVL